jgi:uncharacterized protein
MPQQRPPVYLEPGSSPILEREDEAVTDEQAPAPPPAGRDDTVRTCAVSRTEMPVGCMVRFVAGPDGVMVPDLARRLPGRGVWVELDRARLTEAVRRNVFAKSLKRQVGAPADLVARLEALLVKRVADGLSLANKAGLVVPGFAQVEATLDQGSVVGLFHGRDAAIGGRDKLDRKFKAINTARSQAGLIVTELTIDQMSLAIGRSNVVHAALIPGGATTRLLDEAKRMQRLSASPDASPTAL